MALKFQTCWILAYCNDGQFQIWALSTRAECRQQLYSIVRQLWDEAFSDLEEVMPRNMDEAVREYFDSGDRESYTIQRSK